MSAVLWVDGSLHAVNEPVILAGNHGFTVGDGVFETLAVRKGQAFALTRHLVRLQYSLDRMGMRAVDMAAIREGVRTVIAESPADVVRLRITVVSGPGPMSSCLLYTSPSPRDGLLSRMPSSA